MSRKSAARRREVTGRPTVLFSTGPLKASDNPYLHQLVAVSAEGADIDFLTPLTALRARLDVLHVHWPHQLVVGANPPRTVVKFLTSCWLLGRIRRRRVPVIWTRHNQTSHDSGGRLERIIERKLDRLTSLRIYLNESAENDTERGVVVLHPDYRAWLERTCPELGPGAPPAPQGVLLFGLLRPYKEIESLIAAAAEAGVSTTLAGRPVDPGYGAQLRAAAAATDQVTLDDRHLPDAELAALLGTHRLVVLPYRAMYNSGALLYALSVGVPVLAPSSAANQAIRAEVGAAWLHLYDGPLTAQILADAYAATRQRPEHGPRLERRDWATHGDLHLRAYRGVLASAAGPRTADPAAEQRRNRAALVSDAAFARHSELNRP